jgi:hypothetical protein
MPGAEPLVCPCPSDAERSAHLVPCATRVVRFSSEFPEQKTKLLRELVRHDQTSERVMFTTKELK